MTSREYDLIVSAGDWCGPAHNIRRVFGRERAYPFDWWVTPYRSFVKLLDEDFANLLIPGNLVLTEGNGSIKCNYYGILHHHDFTRDSEKKVISDFMKELPRVIAKTTALIHRLNAEVEGSDVLFVRSSLWDGDGKYQQGSDLRDRAMALWTALSNRYSHARLLDLLVLAPLLPEEIPLHQGNIIIRSLGERICNNFYWDENYTKVFRELHLEMRHGL
jgi:hypothetical protein